MSGAVLLLLSGPAGAPGQSRLPAGPLGLARHMPDVVPDVTGWEHSSGFAHFDAPARSIEYELYVDPRRGASYAVTRYRIRTADPEELRRAGMTDTEKLQWDVDGRTLRRFECRPAAAPRPCEWFEIPHDTPEYHRELEPILAVYAVHSRLLHEREERLKSGR